MFGILKKIFGEEENKIPDDIQKSIDATREQSRKIDEYLADRTVIVEEAVNGNIKLVKEILANEKHPVQKNDLYNLALSNASKNKDNQEALLLCEVLGEEYLEFYEENSTETKSGKFNISYLSYIKALTHLQRYDLAIEVCENAITHGFTDGTQTGYEGRIKRLLKKSEKNI
jgi:hypothetical protein